MLASVALFALMDAGLKILSPHYPAAQVAAMRSISGLPWILLWIGLTVGLRSLGNVRWRLHLLRGLLGIAMMTSFVFGLRSLPLSTAYTLTFVSPLLVTAMAVPLLGERVGPQRWAAVAIGLVGVLVILQPAGEGLISAASLAILFGAVCYAGNVITVRLLARTDSNQAMVFWMVVIMSVGSLALALPTWTAIRPEDYALIGGLGIVGSLAQALLNAAFRRGEASWLIALEYTALLWSSILDATIWGALPGGSTWIGAAIIVASGLYVMRRERQVATP